MTFEKTESENICSNTTSEVHKSLQNICKETLLPLDSQCWSTSCTGNDGYLLEDRRIPIRRVQVQTLPLGGP